MNWKNRLTNYNFWISLVSAVLLILQAFNFEFDIANIGEIATALLGLLVVIGIISNPTKDKTSKNKPQEPEENKAQTPVTPQPVETSDTLTEKGGEGQIPYGEQNEDNSGINQNDIQMLIEKISADIENQTAEKKADIIDVMTELLQANEKGEFMLDNNIVEVESVQPEKEIATEIIEEETNLVENIPNESVMEETLNEDEHDEIEEIEQEEVVVDELQQRMLEELAEKQAEDEYNRNLEKEVSEHEVIENSIEDAHEEEQSEPADEKVEEVICFKIVN